MLSDTHRPVSFKDVTINNGFVANLQTLFRDNTIQAIHSSFGEAGRFDTFLRDLKRVPPDESQLFRESDVTKWIEGAAYFLQHNDMPGVETRIDEPVQRIEEAKE